MKTQVKSNVSSSPSKISLSEALKLADFIVHSLTPHCDRIDVAGSVRRKKSEVKDIEVVCLPKIAILKDGYGWDEGIIRTPGFETAVNMIGKIVKGKPGGKYMAIDIGKGIMLDLFTPDAHDYYRQLAMRTGSADYSFKVIATGWRKIGWCGSDAGLRRTSDCIEVRTPNGKRKWICVAKNAQLPPIWRSEMEFFDWINVKMVVPELRSW